MFIIIWHCFKDLICPSGYEDLWSDSTHCYWITSEKGTWEQGKAKCQDVGAELACFSNQLERDAISDRCEDCWVGYKWQDGKLEIGNDLKIWYLNFSSSKLISIYLFLIVLSIRGMGSSSFVNTFQLSEQRSSWKIWYSWILCENEKRFQ